MTVISELVTSMGPALVVGGTGYIGRFVADACLASGAATYVLVRPALSSPSRDDAIQALDEKGAIILEGFISDKEVLKKYLKEKCIEVVISVVGGDNIVDQLHLVEAIKDVGTVKRFLPSEFGHDIDKATPVEPGLTFYNQKRNVRRAIEAAGIPFTYICCNSIAGWPYHNNTHPSEVCPPLDRFLIYGDGSVPAFFVAGSDIGKFTIKAAYDPRAINKSLHFRPSCNFFNLNEMSSLWETKIGMSLPRVIMGEAELLAMAAENRFPSSVVAALTHDIFIKGCQYNYTIDGHKDVEIGDLYPNMKYKTIDECFNEYVAELLLNQGINMKQASPMAERALPMPSTCAVELA